MPSPTPTRVGRYEIINRLGAGGMGVVYLATDPLLGRTVAIKVLPVHDDDSRERFQREARSAASLRHPNVVTIYDIGEDDGKPFIAMEFLDGESVAEMVNRRAALSIDRRLQLLLDLCAGLGYAHKNGIVHRDIKPGNLMVTVEGPLKVLDFGLARLTSEATNTGLTRVGSVLGTPHYMSPEQAEGRVADERSDIFSVGAVLYEVLTSQKAYPGGSAHVVLHNIINLTPTPIRELVPSIPPELETLVNKALEKTPEKRYQNLRELAADVLRIRTAMSEGANFETMISPRPDPAGGARSKSSKAAETTPGGRGMRHLASLDAIAQRREAQVEVFLQKAGEHFAAERFQETIEACENALLLDAEGQPALQLLAQAQAALDDRQVQQCLVEARACLSAGDLSAASALIEQTLKLRSDSTEAEELQRQLAARRRELAQAAERARSTQSALQRARRCCDDGAFDAALRAVSEALHYDPANQDALAIRQRATEALDKARQRERDAQPPAPAEQARTMQVTEPATTGEEEREREPLIAPLRGAIPPDEETVRISRDAIARMLATAQVPQPPDEVKEQPPKLPRESRPAATAVLPPSEDPPTTVPLPAPSSLAPRSSPPRISPPQRTNVFAAAIANKLPAGVPLWAGAAVALLVIVAAIWLLNRRTPAIVEIEPAPAPAQSAPAVSYADTVQNARQRYQALDIDGAVSLALSVPDSAPERTQSMELLATMRKEAATRAEAERQTAQTSPAFDEQLTQQGAAKMDEAAKLIAAADTARALALYEEAVTLFRQAPAAGWSAERLVREAQAQSAAKKPDAAIDFALQALKLTPDHAEAMQVLQSIKSAAAATVAGASRRARAAGLTDTNSTGFREARARENAARALRSPAETKAALKLYAAAAAAYGSGSIDVATAPVTTAPVTPSLTSIVQGHVQHAEERLAAGDLPAANAAIREIETLDPANARLGELKKLAEARRPAPVTQPKPGEIEKVVADSARIRDDGDAIRFLTGYQATFPGNAAIAAALSSRQQMRDNRISELLQRARGANDEKAVELLNSALVLNPARADVRAERDRRFFPIKRVQIERTARDLLDKFESALEARSVAQFVNIATYRTATDIGQEFQSYRNIRVDIDDVKITVQQDGTATVLSTIRLVRQPASGGNSVTDRRPWQLRIASVAGAWRITEAGPR